MPKIKNKTQDTVAQWYIITIVSGNEDSVVKNLKGKIEAYGLTDLVQDIKVIKDKVVEEEIFTELDLPSNYGRKMKDVVWESFKDANGKNKFKKIKTIEMNRYFGYIFIKMIMTEDAWFAIRNTQLITGIVGSSGKNAKPIPVGDDEIGQILNAASNDELATEILKSEGKEVSVKGDSIIIQTKIEHNFNINQTVNIINGQFKNEQGNITQIDDSKGKLLVTINIFGRDTTVEIGFEDVELDS
ncbi:MAG: transcription termination/antitermination protein NusG [Mycoplasma sp.]